MNVEDKREAGEIDLEYIKETYQAIVSKHQCKKDQAGGHGQIC